jgi:hypothetical protein
MHEPRVIGDGAVCDIRTQNPRTENPVHISGCWALRERHSVVAHLALQHVFRQWRSVVWGVWLVADRCDWAKVAKTTKRFGGAKTTHRCPDDHYWL